MTNDDMGRTPNKTCRDCGLSLPPHAFPSMGVSKSGSIRRQARCRDCWNAYQREYGRIRRAQQRIEEGKAPTRLDLGEASAARTVNASGDQLTPDGDPYGYRLRPGETNAQRDKAIRDYRRDHKRNNTNNDKGRANAGINHHRDIREAGGPDPKARPAHSEAGEPVMSHARYLLADDPEWANHPELHNLPWWQRWVEAVDHE